MVPPLLQRMGSAIFQPVAAVGVQEDDRTTEEEVTSELAEDTEIMPVVPPALAGHSSHLLNE